MALNFGWLWFPTSFLQNYVAAGSFGKSGGWNVTWIMTTQMVGGLKTVHVKAEHVAEFERLFTELRSEIGKHEPDCLLYSLLKSRTKPGAYIVQEQYRTQAALEAHQKSAHGAKYFPKMRAIIEIQVEYFDGVVD
jgi:quinol monooxygenase YgiN